VPVNSVVAIARASSGPRICPACSQRYFGKDRIDWAVTGTLQPLEFLKGRPSLFIRAEFGQPRHQIVGVDTRVPRRQPDRFGLVDVEPLDSGGFEQDAIE
jgi:hypothetical protein